MEDKSKVKEKTPEKKIEKIEDENAEELQPEGRSVEPEEKKETQEVTGEEPESEEEVKEISKELIEKKYEDKPDDLEVEEVKKQIKAEVKIEKPKKDRDSDFKYIVRLSNTDVDGEKNIVYGLTSIKGIGVHMATLITGKTRIDRNMKIGELKDHQIEILQDAIDNINKNAPGWMLNHRKDYETGNDIHLIGSDIDMQFRDEINIMKKIRSYRGIRHERGLPVRGQRTRANNRKGLALGVSKKREQTSK